MKLHKEQKWECQQMADKQGSAESWREICGEDRERIVPLRPPTTMAN